MFLYNHSTLGIGKLSKYKEYFNHIIFLLNYLRCGIFIASSILFNSLIVANQFDVAQVVRQLRASRANMISTFVS